MLMDRLLLQEGTLSCTYGTLRQLRSEVTGQSREVYGNVKEIIHKRELQSADCEDAQLSRRLDHM